jgi:hypothetical protein
MLPENLYWKFLGVTKERVPRFSFISDQLFRITQPNCLNDPFEMQPRVLLEEYSPEDRGEARRLSLKTNLFSDSHPSDEDIEQLFLAPFPNGRFDEKRFPGLWPVTIPELRTEPFQTLAELDKFRARKLRENIQELLNNTFGVFSLTKNPCELLMWAHYAAEHRGIAVGFDCTHRFFLDTGVLRDVEYLPKRVSISSNGGIIRIAGKKLKAETLPPIQTLLIKHPSWYHEKEIRFIVPLASADEKQSLDDTIEKIYLKKIPCEAIRAIVLGVRVTEQQQIDIIAKLRSETNMKHVRLFKAKLDDTEFALEFNEINTV